MSQRALPGTVRSHDGVEFAGVNYQVNTFQDRFILYSDVEVLDLKHKLFSKIFFQLNHFLQRIGMINR